MKRPSVKHIFTHHKHALFISLSFLVLNLIQASFTPLLNDESYYWLYAKELQWGYFDHPPFIALLIKLSTQIFPAELGVRLLVVLAACSNIFLWVKLLEKETKAPIHSTLAILLIGGSLFLNLYSFLAIPDAPLLFSTGLFFWFYSTFLEKDHWGTNLLLGLSVALLLYSKYHGVLIIFFTLLSNLKVLKRRSFYIVCLTAMLLFLPHLYWLYEHDFLTIRFQLFERSHTGFRIDHVLSYIGEQLGITGPVFILLFSLLYKPKNAFQKALKYNVIGIFMFFLFSSFRQRLNTHWTAVAWIPMLILCYLYIVDKKLNNVYLTGLLGLNVALVLCLRAILLFDLTTIPHFNDKNLPVMAATLGEAAGDQPLVFLDTYIEPSGYMFYQGKNCFSINTTGYKKTQFNYLNTYEKAVQHRPVKLVTRQPFREYSEQVVIPKGKTYYLTEVPDFHSYFTTFSVNAYNLSGTLKTGEVFTITYTISSSLNKEERADLSSPDYQLGLCLIHTATQQAYGDRTILTLDESEKQTFQITLPPEAGTYKCIFYLYHKDKPYLKGFNSRIYMIRLEA